MHIKPTLRQKLLDALAASSSQKPVATSTMYQLGTRKLVEATLLEMYHAQVICCCKITKGGGTHIVWWLAAQFEQFKSPWQLNQEKLEKVKSQAKKPQVKRVSRRMSPISIEVKDVIFAHPGLAMPEVYEKLNKQAAEHHRIRVAIGSLVCLGYIRTEGIKRNYRYFPVGPA